MSDWKTPNLAAVTGSLLGLGTCFVGLRLWTRRRLKVPLQADDWSICLALVMFLGSSISVFLGIRYKSFGISSYSLTPEEDLALDPIAYKITLPATLFSYLTLGLSKASALFFYKRIFCVSAIGFPYFKWLVHMTLVLVAGWVIAFCLLDGLQCGTHFTALWSLQNHNKYCLYSYSSIYGLTISDVILDIWVLGLPLPQIFKLQKVKLSRKLGIAGVFLLALVGLVASIIRLSVWLPIGNAGELKNERLDPREIDSKLCFYYVLECGMSIIAVNMPVVAVSVFRVAFPAVWQFARSWASSITSLGQKVSQGGRSSDADGDMSIASLESGQQEVVMKGIRSDSK